MLFTDYVSQQASEQTDEGSVLNAAGKIVVLHGAKNENARSSLLTIVRKVQKPLGIAIPIGVNWSAGPVES